MSSFSNPLASRCRSKTKTMRKMTIEQLTFALPILTGLANPMLQITMVAMSEKLLKLVLQSSLTTEEYERLSDGVFKSIESDPIARVFLMYSLSFFECFAVAVSLVLVIAIGRPMLMALSGHYLNKREVKRLQKILYTRFILEPNSFSTTEARDLVHSKLATIEKYWNQSKYWQVFNLTEMFAGLAMILALAWSLGLMLVVFAGVIFFLTSVMWKRLSSPYSEKLEEKERNASEQLLDLVLCKEVVLTHANEKEEQARLHEAVDSDCNEIQSLMKVVFVTRSFEAFTFTMIVPLMFVFVREITLTIKAVFQLLIVVVVLNECLHAYLDYTKRVLIEEDFRRAQKDMCLVLNMEMEELFPPIFQWKNLFCWKQSQDSKMRSKVGKRTDETHNTRSIQHGSDDFSSDGSEDLQAEESDDVSSDGSDDLQAQESDHLYLEEFEAKFSNANAGKKFEETLGLEDISFGYKLRDGGTYEALKDLNLRLKLGVHYGFMGETGAGKSTVFKGLAGLLRPLQGNITFAGEVVDTSSLAWRKKIAVVMQNSVMFNRTLRENLKYGNHEGCSDEQIFAALEKVNMKKRVQALPKGLDTVIQANGDEFSGGQRQRFQIARLLLRDCPLVLLDEFTSALDAETTDDILEVLKPFLDGKTVFMITHSIQTLVLADTVLKLTSDGYITGIRKRRTLFVD